MTALVIQPRSARTGPTAVRRKGVRSGNRQLNAALYRIAMTQIRHNGPGEAYYRRRRDAGDSHAEALRRLERRVARTIFGHLRNEHTNTAAPYDPTPSLVNPQQPNIASQVVRPD